MFRMPLWAVFFLIVLDNACPGRGQSDAEFPLNYNLPQMITRVNSIYRTSQDLKSMENDSDAFSVLDQLNHLISDEALESFLKGLFTISDQDRCKQDIEYVFQNLQAKDQWGLKMLDSMGKPESGILGGNLKWLGSYHECTQVYAPPNENSTAGDFNGQYCTMDLSVEIKNMTLPITLGVCLPESCGSLPVESFKESRGGSSFNITKKTCQPVSRKVTGPAIGMIFALSVFVVLALIGSSITVYDYIMKLCNEEDSICQYSEQINDGDVERNTQDSSKTTLIPNERKYNGWYGTTREFFTCFCIFSNGEKLLNTDGTEGQLLCLHGIRFLSMTWVIVCHAYLCILSIASVDNMLETLVTLDTFLFQIIFNGFFSVDSFFLLSGFLVSYLYFQETAKTNGKVSWLYFYIHRYVRLTPVFMMVLGFLTALNYYVGSGPFWTTNEIEPVCQENWWYNILYINNFVSQSKQCMAWTWYLANDMQFFVVSPVLLITLWRWPKIGYSLLGLVMSATIAANFGITYHYDLHTGYGGGGREPDSVMDIDLPALMDQQTTFFEDIYIKPYTRMSPYLVGIALAYILFKRKQSNAGKLSTITLVCGWIVAAAMALTCQFYLYHRKLSVVESGFYYALSHAGFTIGLSWVIFTCLNGQAGVVNSILSFKLFIPLSRLTYCAYLIHPLVLGGYFGSLKTTVHFSHMTMVTLYLGLLLITYAFSFVVSVLFESPIIRLDKLVRTKLKS